MKRVMARAEERSIGYAPTLGEPGLRRQIAFRYLDTIGSNVEPDNICITNGGQEALLLALQAVANKGDIIAVESPTYHGLLELIDSLGMLAGRGAVRRLRPARPLTPQPRTAQTR